MRGSLPSPWSHYRPLGPYNFGFQPSFLQSLKGICQAAYSSLGLCTCCSLCLEHPLAPAALLPWLHEGLNRDSASSEKYFQTLKSKLEATFHIFPPSQLLLTVSWEASGSGVKGWGLRGRPPGSNPGSPTCSPCDLAQVS